MILFEIRTEKVVKAKYANNGDNTATVCNLVVLYVSTYEQAFKTNFISMRIAIRLHLSQ